MKPEQLLQSLLLTGTFVVVVSIPALGEEVRGTDEESFGTLTAKGATVEPIRNIPRLSDIQLPFTNALKLVQSPAPSEADAEEVVEVTGVRLNPTDQGVEIILETSYGEELQVTPKTEGNTYIAEIPNAQLRLPGGNTFSQENPTEGISLVTVTNQDANNIRVAVTGEEGVPTVELYDSDEGLIFDLAPAGVTGADETPETPEEPETPETPQTSETPQTPQTPQTSQTPAEEDEPGVDAPEQEPAAEVDEPIELVVTGSAEAGYIVPDATSATRTDTPIINVPRTIQVIPRQVIEDQKAIQLDEALRNVSGVVRNNNFGGTTDGVIIRGFNSRILQNGFPEVPGTSTFDVIRETANIQRVEVLKGPASVLYGNLEPGGVVNLITEKPLEDPYYASEIFIGSESLYRPTIDISGPLTANNNLLYRLNAVYENSSGFRDFTDIERYFFAPVINWKISDRTDLFVEVNYLSDERPFDRGVVAIGRGVADIPISRRLGEPGDVREIDNTSADYTLEHRFSENWTLRNSFRTIFTDEFTRRFEPRSLNEETGILRREFRTVEAYRESFALQTNLVGEFRTGSIQHQALFGVDLSRANSDLTVFRERNGIPSINIFNPVYGAAIPDAPLSVEDYTRIDGVGVYLQDQLNFSDNFFLLLGGRFDWVDQEVTNRIDDTSVSQSDNAFSPSVGIVYKPIPSLSLYSSFSQSFTPNIGRTFDLESLEPERSSQYEVGVKGEFLDGRLFATLAAYQITKRNVATVDLDNPDFLNTVGEQRSRGIELDVLGEILPGWNIIASYGYNDAEITKDNALEEGNRLVNVPRHNASLWTTYEFQNGGLRGLGFGAGLFFVGERAGDNENTFDLPSYLRTDAAIYYRRDNWRLGINIKNLFDVRHFESSAFGRERIYPGIPLTVLGTLSVEF